MRQLDELKDVKGAPARYVDATGDTMTGNLNFNTSLQGINWSMNTDYAKINFKNNGDDDTDSYLHFITGDNGNEYFKFSQQSGATTTELMSIKSDGIRFKGTSLSLDGHTHPYIPLSGGICSGTVQFASGYSSKGIRFNDNGATINSSTGEDLVLLKVSGGIRFSDVDTWDYNSWAGVKYVHADKRLYIGGPLGSKITSNGTAEQIDIDMTTANSGVTSVYATNLNVGGTLYMPNASMSISFGDDIRIGDGNMANHLVLQGGQNPEIAGITFGSGKDTNIYRGGANILQTDDLFNAIGGFQFNGQPLDERYFSRRWEVGVSTDWNTLIHPGCYKVQMTAWGDASTNAPRQGYTYGLLMVYRTGVTSEDRMYQVYMPHRTDEARWFRMSNGGAWHNWEAQEVRTSGDNRYFTKFAPRLSGVDLNNYSTGGFYAVVNHEQACSNMPLSSDGYLMVVPWSNGEWASQIFINDGEGEMYLRTKTGAAVTNWTSWGKVYDSNHKPTPAEIGAVATSNVSNTFSNNTVAQRDNAGDINARLFRTNYQDENYMSGAIAFRANNNSDNYTRYCSAPGAVRGWLEFGQWRFSNQDLIVYNKRALVGMNDSDGNKLYINYQGDFASGTMVNGRLNIGDASKFMDLGISSNDIAIGNSKNSSWLQLKDDGRLCYNNRNVQLEPQQSPLWSGATYLGVNQNVTPSKGIRDCQNGWALIFSDYDAGGDPNGNNWNYSIHLVPKNSQVINSGNLLFSIPNYEVGGWTIKAAYIKDNQILGNSSDKIDGWNDVVLRQVLEY